MCGVMAVGAGGKKAAVIGWYDWRYRCPGNGIALHRREQVILVVEEVRLRSNCLVLVSISLGLYWGVPAASQSPSPGQVSRGADGADLEGVREAIQVFRQVTASAGLRPGQRNAEQPTAQAGGRASSWHGRLFEYFRNDILDAVPHEVVQRGGERNLRRRNQFGFTVNGPVVIPGVYNGRGSSFFTFSYEGTRERVGRSYLTTLPTTQQRFADFSDLVNRAGRPLTVYDPASTRRNPQYDPSRPVSRSNLQYRRDPFPLNRIPTSRIDRVAAAASAHYPEPNTSVGPFLRNNYWTNPSERNSPDGFITRVDHNLGELQKITVRLNASDDFQETPDLYPTAGNLSRPDRMFRNRGVELSDTANLTANVTFHGRIEVNHQVVDTNSLSSDRNLPSEIGLEGVDGVVFPALRVRRYAGLGPSTRSYLRNAQTVFEFDSTLIVRKGNHTWTIASDSRALDWGTHELDAPSGSFSFDDRITGLPGITNTGDGFATFLLGQAWRAQATDQPQPAYIRRRSFQNSVSNQWQALPNLTLSFRLAVDAASPRTEKFDRQSTFDPGRIEPRDRNPWCPRLCEPEWPGASVPALPSSCRAAHQRLLEPDCRSHHRDARFVLSVLLCNHLAHRTVRDARLHWASVPSLSQSPASAGRDPGRRLSAIAESAAGSASRLRERHRRGHDPADRRAADDELRDSGGRAQASEANDHSGSRADVSGSGHADRGTHRGPQPGSY